MLVVEVPEAAAIVINGQHTDPTGPVREFVATGLSADSRYEYEVTMILDEGGTRREVTKTVWLATGTEQTLSFDPGAAPAGAVNGLANSPDRPSPAVETTASAR